MKPMNLNLLIMIVLAVISNVTLAGWSSGGGELLRDQINPWFLNNVNQVKYCIEVDEVNFGQTKQQIRPRILNAFEFWRLQFKDLKFYQTNDAGPLIQLDKINFVESVCDSETDLRFQFGVLTDEQKNRLPNIRDFIGLTIRTDYDLKNLKGKGFIYISPQDGPLKPVAGNVLKDFWSISSGSLLFPTLIHELGHVFGIQHNTTVAMMDEGFIEALVSSQFQDSQPDGSSYYKKFENENWKKVRLFKFSTEHGEAFKITSCLMHSEPMPIPFPIEPEPKPIHFSKVFKGLPHSTQPIFLKHRKQLIKRASGMPERPIPKMDELLGIPEMGSNCSTYGIENDKFVAKYKKNHEDPWITAGSMDLEKPWFEDYLGTNNVIHLWIPADQIVIPQDPFSSVNSRRVVASGFSQVVFKGTYKSTDGKQNRRLVLTATPTYLESIGGVIDGEIYYDLETGF